MKSDLKTTKKVDKKVIKTNKLQDVVLLGEAEMLIAIISAFIISRYIIELTVTMNIYLVILACMMAYTSYSIYKRKFMTIIYILFAISILISIFMGI